MADALKDQQARAAEVAKYKDALQRAKAYALSGADPAQREQAKADAQEIESYLKSISSISVAPVVQQKALTPAAEVAAEMPEWKRQLTAYGGQTKLLMEGLKQIPDELSKLGAVAAINPVTGGIVAGTKIRDLVEGTTPDERLKKSYADTAELKQIMEPLPFGGKMAASVVNSLPLLAVPGANTITGAALQSAAASGMEGVTSPAQRAENAGLGLLVGGATMGGLKLAGGATKQGAQMVRPWLPGGPERIAAEDIVRMSKEPEQLLTRLAAGDQVGANIPGLTPTTAEVTKDVGIAAMNIGDNPIVTNALKQQRFANLSAVVEYLRSHGADKGKIEALEKARELASAPAYKAALATQFSPQEADTFKQLLDANVTAPGAHGFIRDAVQQLRYDKDWLSSPQMADNVKKVLDTFVFPAQNSAEAVRQGQIENARKAIVEALKTTRPAYEPARKAYAAASVPLNQAQTYNELYNKLTPALSRVDDVATPGAVDVKRITANRFAEALADPDALVRHATGRSDLNFGAVFPDGENVQPMLDVQNYLKRLADVDAMSKSLTGSTTAQNLGVNRLIQDSPIGEMIQGSIGRVLPNVMTDISRLPKSLYKGIEPVIAQKRAEYLMHPQELALALANMNIGKPAQTGFLSRMNSAKSLALSDALSDYVRATGEQ